MKLEDANIKVRTAENAIKGILENLERELGSAKVTELIAKKVSAEWSDRWEIMIEVELS